MDECIDGCKFRYPAASGTLPVSRLPRMGAKTEFLPLFPDERSDIFPTDIQLPVFSLKASSGRLQASAKTSPPAAGSALTVGWTRARRSAGANTRQQSPRQPAPAGLGGQNSKISFGDT